MSELCVWEATNLIQAMDRMCEISLLPFLESGVLWTKDESLLFPNRRCREWWNNVSPLSLTYAT